MEVDDCQTAAGWRARLTPAGRGEGGPLSHPISSERSLVQQLHHDDEAGKGQEGQRGAESCRVFINIHTL